MHTVAALCVVVLAVDPAQAEKYEYGPHLVAFVRQGNLWLMAPHGYNDGPLSYSGNCRHPSWAPDGESLVYESAGNIWRMALRHTALTKLTTTGDCHQPAWRPGTNEVWYCRLSALGRDGYVESVSAWAVNAVTRKTRRIAEVAGGLVEGPGRTSWRSDGGVVAMDFQCGGEGGEPAFLQADGRPTEVSLHATNRRWGNWAFLNPAWSPVAPNALALAVLYREAPHGPMGSDFAWSLVLLDTETHEETPVYDAPHPPPPTEIGMVSWPSWSPDGKRLVFTVWEQWGGPTGPSVWIATPDGRYAHRVAEDAESPAWSPLREG